MADPMSSILQDLLAALNTVDLPLAPGTTDREVSDKLEEHVRATITTDESLLRLLRLSTFLTDAVQRFALEKLQTVIIPVPGESPGECEARASYCFGAALAGIIDMRSRKVTAVSDYDPQPFLDGLADGTKLAKIYTALNLVVPDESPPDAETMKGAETV